MEFDAKTAVGMVVIGCYPSRTYYDADWQLEKRRVLVEAVTQVVTEGILGPTIHGRDLDRGTDVTLVVSAMQGLEMLEATPESVFPPLGYDIVVRGDVRHRFVEDARMHFATAYLDGCAECLVLPSCNPVAVS